MSPITRADFVRVLDGPAMRYIKEQGTYTTDALERREQLRAWFLALPDSAPPVKRLLDAYYPLTMERWAGDRIGKFCFDESNEAPFETFLDSLIAAMEEKRPKGRTARRGN